MEKASTQELARHHVSHDGMDDPAPLDLDLLYGVRAIAEALGLRVNQTDHLCRAGRIPTFRIGGRICSRRSWLGEWLDEQTPSPVEIV